MPLLILFAFVSLLSANQDLQGFKPLFHTLDVGYQADYLHPLQYFGYAGQFDEEDLKEIIADNANFASTDFGWLGSFLVPDEKAPGGVRIDRDNPRFEIFRKYLENCARLGLKSEVGVITCTNFHEYPDWFNQRYPDIFARDSAGNTEPLLYEIDIPPERKKAWTNIEHPILNLLRGEFAQAVINAYKDQPSVILWGMDGETLYPPVPAERGFDQSLWALRHFRQYLALKYKNIRSLNKAWGTNYRSFQEVYPPKDLSQRSLPLLDWHSFRIHAITEYLQSLFIRYKSTDPHRPTFAWLHDMSLRWDELKRAGCAPFEYALVGDGLIANPIVRPPNEEYNTKYFEMMTSFGKPVASPQLAYYPRPWPGYMIRRQVYECLGLGVWLVGLITWTWPEGYLINWGIKGTEGQSEVRKVFGELKQLAPYLDFMWPVRPAIRVFVSQPVWILDGWKKSWDALHLDFLKRQIPKRYIVDWQILQDQLVKDPSLKILISLDNEIIDEKVLLKMEDFVKKGGILVILGSFNELNENLQPPKQPPFLKKLSPHRSPRGTVYHRASYGKGEVFRIEEGYSSEVLDVIEEILSPRVLIRPLKITRSEPSFALLPLVADNTDESHDLADDFSGYLSLGQLVISPGEYIHSLSICTPTYWKVNRLYKLKMEVLLGGPRGEKIAERIVPPEEIMDNAWLEIIVDRQTKKGEKLYLRVSPLEPLPPQTIGWWSLRIKPEEDGGAYVDDEPVKGIKRRIRITYKALQEGRSLVETFLLSDGVNMGIVLVNTSEEPMEVHLQLDERAIPHPQGTYLVKEPLSGALLGKFRGKQAGGVAVKLGKYGTAFLLYEYYVGREDVASLLQKVRRGLEVVRNKEGDTSLGENFLAVAERHFEEGNYSKALAGLLRCDRLLYLTSPKREDKNGKTILAFRIIDGEGKEVKGATLQALLSPLLDFPLPWRELGEGTYEITIERQALPPVYNHQKARYEPYKGEARVEVSVMKQVLQGKGKIPILLKKF